MFTTKCKCSAIENYSQHMNAYFVVTFACFQLVYLPSKYEVRGSLGRHKSQYHPSAAFSENKS